MSGDSHLDRLRAAGVPDAEHDLRRLTDWAFDGIPMASRPDAQDAWSRLDAAVDRRADREPVSKIKGTRAFWNHNFAVTKDVLDPRPDTETLIEVALQHPFATVLDLGTGSGCIAISLLAERPQARGTATDISQAALTVAAGNAQKIGVEDRLRLMRSDWFENVEGSFDLIVSNPPYISDTEMADLAPEVRDHDPTIALTPGGDGLSAYRCIATTAPDYLAAQGRLILEIGWKQAVDVSNVLQDAGFVDVTVHTDLGGRDRVVCATCS